MGRGPTDPSEPYFDKGLWGYDGSEWRKLQLLWGYYDRWLEDLSAQKVGNGSFLDSTTPVPAGYVYVLQCASLTNVSGARGSIRIKIPGTIGQMFLAYSATPGQLVPVYFSGVLVLKEGDVVTLEQLSCLDGDWLYGVVWGYKMRLNL